MTAGTAFHCRSPARAMTTLQNPSARGGSLEGLHAGAPCDELYEWCKRNAHACDWAERCFPGPFGMLVWLVTLRVRKSGVVEGAEENAVSANGRSGSIKVARDRAAAAALDQLDVGWRARLAAHASAGAQQPLTSSLGTATAAHVASGAERRSLAHVGDATLHLLLALLARSAGVDAAGVDGLRQRLLNTHALGGGPAAATEREAAIGTAVCAAQTQLTALLEDAVRKADPDLLAQLQQALL